MASKYFTEVKNLSATAGGASGDVVYTCPSFHVSVIQFLNISNGATSSKKYSIQWYEAATTTYHTIVDEVSLAASTNESLLTNGFLAATTSPPASSNSTSRNRCCLSVKFLAIYCFPYL